MKVILVYLKTYGSSSLDELDYNIVFFLHKKNSMPAIFKDVCY